MTSSRKTCSPTSNGALAATLHSGGSTTTTARRLSTSRTCTPSQTPPHPRWSKSFTTAGGTPA
eukprot:CAMPEP_0114164704 /NCGR_PEP_ID=MMETSP0043_2-20121206/30816_1 /TAXON_ID=464988 /ORGANISM="Hemiselmis andersenii, Strain CCMP644" /LENGTH=62 /DNA_ID=CAMNT_0001261395 /DNA_START=58 /DNA_END=243 /DNA_ORIENTATION=-